MDKLDHMENEPGKDNRRTTGPDSSCRENSDTPCELIHDLLPLYADGAACSSSCRMVEEHLKKCPDCAEKLRMMKDDDSLRKSIHTVPPGDDIDYMKKSRRATILIGLFIMILFIIFAGIVLILDNRQENDHMYNDRTYPGVSTNLYWQDGGRFTYKGEEYSYFDLSESDENCLFFLDSAFPIDEEKDVPEFTVSEKVSRWDKFMKKTYTVNMFRVKSGTGLPFFYDNYDDGFACRTSDTNKFKKYYCDIKNYRFETQQWSDREDKNGDPYKKKCKIALTDEEKRFLSDMNDDMADTELRDDLPEIRLYQISLDGLYSSDIEFICKNGRWYYAAYNSEREQEDFEDEDITYVMCIRLPDSLNDKLNDNYVKGW